MIIKKKIVEKNFSQAVAEFDSNPLALVFLRRLANESPAMFFAEAVTHLSSSHTSNAHRFLTVLALRHGELTDYLVNPAHSTREVALRLFNRMLSVDPSFDVKLAQLLPDRGYINHAVALEGASAIRALDILDQTSRGRRLLPILGHLPSSSDARVAAKATLFVGKRVQSPAWSAKQMSHPDQRVRANAVESIWGLDTQPAMQLLEKCIDDKNTRVVGNALLGLHITGHRDVERELVFSSKHALPDRRSMAAWTMGRTGKGEWAERLTAMVKDEHPQVRGMALRALRDIRHLERNTPEAIAARAGEAAEAAKQEKIKRAAEQVGVEAASPNAFGHVDYVRVG